MKLFNKIVNPISSEFLTEEEIKQRKKLRNQNIHNIIKKTTTIARESLNIYYQMREKNPISIGLGILSAYGVVSDNILNNKKDTGDESYVLKEFGYTLSHSNIATLLRDFYKNINIEKSIIWSGEDSLVEKYKLNENNSVCFTSYIHDQDYIVGPYIKNRNFIEITADLIEKNIGNYLTLSVNDTEESWKKCISLEPLNICKDAYISPINEDNLILDIIKFFNKGMNRSLLFEGTPGSGKTTLAIRLTEKLGGRILVISGWNLSNRTSGSVWNIVDVCNPSIILFDDLDNVADVEGLLGDMEIFNKMKNNINRLFIATVNNIDELPKALIRPGRFDQIIKFNFHNNKDVCLQILKAHANQIKFNISQKELERISDLAVGLTGAYLREIILRASVLGIDNIEKHVKDMKILISEDEDEDNNKDKCFETSNKPIVKPYKRFKTYRKRWRKK